MADPRPLSVVSGKSIALAANTPLPVDDDTSSLFQEPRPPYFSSNNPASAESPRESFLLGTPRSVGSESGQLLPMKSEDQEAPVSDVSEVSEENTPRKTSRRRPLFIFLIAAIALIVVGLAVVIPVYFTVIKPRKNSLSSSSAAHQSSASPSSTGTPTAGNGTSTPPGSKESITGGDGSTIRLANGTSFTYRNSFGGIWYSDPNDPYNNNAYPNSWTPPLNQSWDYGNDRMYGVNIGGWFVIEPFITPALFQRYPGAVDEWSLSTLMAEDTANGGLNQIEDHYKTFITEQDIADIAAAGLNWIRLPIPFWAIDTWGDEPFLAKTSWNYIVQAFQWCRKYGLRVNLDFHTVPGSQNGYNHSGKSGQINFMMGTMGMANAQRAMNYIRIITEFISQPEWRDVVVMFGIMNEPLVTDIGKTQLGAFYVETYEMIRGIAGVGEGKGPFISIHEGFQGLQYWDNFLTGADRIAVDQHPYFAFTGSSTISPIDTGVGANAGGIWPGQACGWAGSYNSSRTTFGVTIAGEFSNGFNDCGLFLNGVDGGSTSGDCATWQDSTNWTPGTKAGIQAFAEASMDALRDWFFWTWKVAPDQSGIVGSPLWSYSLGLAGGWMPTDPRTAVGACGPAAGPAFDGTFESWMTGGAGAGVIAAAQTELYPYPPTDLQGTAVAGLPLYTSTGSIATLPVPTASGNAVASGNGWFNANDAQPAPTGISGCTYPDPWNALTAAAPAGCSGSGTSIALPAVITPPPSRR